MKTLSREQAIKRIRDIMKDESCEHIYKLGFTEERIYNYHKSFAYYGAINELRAIFDIKEEELK